MKLNVTKFYSKMIDNIIYDGWWLLVAYLPESLWLFVEEEKKKNEEERDEKKKNQWIN